jgi:membrane protein implicated in regulation of membrane protease activity
MYLVLWMIVAILLVLWMMGWSMQIAGIHLLLLLTFIVVLLWKLASAKATAKSLEPRN